MKRKKLKPMPKNQLEALPTKVLLARLNHLHRCEQSLESSDQAGEDYTASGFIEFKNSPEWITEYTLLKEILANREHIPRKANRSVI